MIAIYIEFKNDFKTFYNDNSLVSNYILAENYIRFANNVWLDIVIWLW